MNRHVPVGLLAGCLLATAGWAQAAELTTRVSGVVEVVLVKSGQQVKKGTALLRLETTVLRAQLEEALAGVRLATVEEQDSRRELARAQELFDRTVSSTSELELAVTRHSRAAAQLVLALARETIAHKNLDDAELKAPFDGRVVSVPGLPGTVVTAECQPRALVIFKP